MRRQIFSNSFSNSPTNIILGRIENVQEAPLLKAGIFLDSDNLSRNGGWGMQFSILKDLVKAQGATVLRASAYMAIDRTRETEDDEYRTRKREYREAIRRSGFHLVLKEVRRYYDEDGDVVLKANVDLDLAVEALLQSENLDYLLIGTGDGDYLRLVRALQSKGKRVDVFAFDNVSRDLRNEADHYFPGLLIPGLLPNASGTGRHRGILHQVFEDKGYGFITMHVGLGPDEIVEDVFLHITEYHEDGQPVPNSRFARLSYDQSVIEFDLIMQEEGRHKGKLVAMNALEYRLD